MSTSIPQIVMTTSGYVLCGTEGAYDLSHTSLTPSEISALCSASTQGRVSSSSTWRLKSFSVTHLCLFLLFIVAAITE